MSAIVVDDHVVHYEVLGRGRPLILLHGWVGSWRYWISIMQAVSNEYRAYALDLWGFGDSDHVPARYSLNQQAGLVRSFMHSLGLPKAALIGHGFGGLVGLYLAAQDPSLAERLMLINVPLTPDTVHPRLTSTPARELSEWLLNTGTENEPVIDEIEKADPKAIQAWYSPDGATEWQPSLEIVDPPCLVVYGKKDPAVQPAPNLPGLEPGKKHHLINFDDSGHFPMLDESSKFCRLLADFLALPTGEPMSQLQLRSEWKRRVR